jgi:hypothetical protein
MIIIDKIVQWMIQSSWFHKYSGMIGAFCAGLWFQAHFWKQIFDSLSVWGVNRNEYLNALLLIIGASGISISIIGTLVKNNQTNRETNTTT